MTTPDTSLARRSTRGAIWNGLSYIITKTTVLVSTVILARVLSPDDFGLVAVGLLAIGYLELVNDFGIPIAVIQSRDDGVHVANVAFWINVTLGVALTAIGLLSAPAIADFFQDDRATDIVRVLAGSFLISSVGSIHQARLRRRMAFSRLTVPEVAKGVVKGSVSIGLALAGFGVWSLVWGQLAGQLVASILYIVMLPWRPRFDWDPRTGRALIGFGAQITLIGILGTVLRNADYIVIGRILGTRALGLYTLAFRMPQLLVEGISTVVGQVVFPAFSKVQDNPVRLRHGLQRVLTYTMIVTTPLALGLAIIADPFVRVFYGSKWVAAIDVMQLLSVYMLIQVASRSFGEVYKAVGRPGILTRLAVVKLAVTLPLLVIAAPHGIVAVAWAQVAASLVATMLDLVMATRVIGLRPSQLGSAYAPSARAGTVMVTVCLIVMWALRDVSDLVDLIALIAAGAASYIGALACFDRVEFLGMLRIVGFSNKARETTSPDFEANAREEV